MADRPAARRFREVRQKFDAAKLNLFSYVQTVDDDMTDAEIDAVFKQMQALRVPMFTTNQTRVGMGPRVAPLRRSTTSRPRGTRTPRSRTRTRWRHRRAWKSCSGCRRHSSSTSTSVISRRATTTRSRFCASTTSGLRTCTSRIATAKRAQRSAGNRRYADQRVRGPRSRQRVADHAHPGARYRDAPGTAVEQSRWQLNYLKGLLER